jgi:hypothetical protein
MRRRLWTGGGRGSETAVVEQALHDLVHAATILWREMQEIWSSGSIEKRRKNSIFKFNSV